MVLVNIRCYRTERILSVSKIWRRSRHAGLDEKSEQARVAIKSCQIPSGIDIAYRVINLMCIVRQ